MRGKPICKPALWEVDISMHTAWTTLTSASCYGQEGMSDSGVSSGLLTLLGWHPVWISLHTESRRPN